MAIMNQIWKKRLEVLKMGKDKQATKELVEKFDNLCEKYSCEDIDVKMLKKQINDVIDNWSS